MKIAHNRNRRPKGYKTWLEMYAQFKSIKVKGAKLFGVTDGDTDSMDLYDESFLAIKAADEALKRLS